MESYGGWITLIILVVGTLGTLVPLLPGLSLMALAVIIYGFIEGFKNTPMWFIILTVSFALIGFVLEYITGAITAKRLGASKAGILGAFVGGILGIVLLGPVGLLLGPFLGAIAGELYYGKPILKAFITGVGSLLGLAIANGIQFIFAVITTILFYFNVLK